MYSNTVFENIFKTPLYLNLFILGCLGPVIASIFTFIINKDELGGLGGFLAYFKINGISRSAVLIPLYTIIHYGLGYAFGNVGLTGRFIEVFKYLPIMFILLGLSEIGWRIIVQPSFEEEKGYNKSIIITGLLWSLWFLPLIFIKGFIILPQFYTQFAGYLVGISFLLTAIYKSNKCLLQTILLSTLIFALAPIIVFKQGFMLMGIALAEAIISNSMKNIKI